MTKKTYQQLSESERHAIALGLQQKQNLSAMASMAAEILPALAQRSRAHR